MTVASAFAGLAKQRVRIPTGDRHDHLAAWALLLLILWVFRDAVFGGQVFYWRDVNMVWHPQVASLTYCFAAGAWPLWDPYRGFGQPLLADPSAHVLYPFAWLRLIVEPAAYYTVFVVSHFFFSALGVLAFSRRLGTSRAGSLTAALIWILSGPFLSLTSLWHHLAGATWIPWVFLSGHQVLVEGRRRDSFLFGAVVAMQLLAGSADMVLLSAATFLAYGVLRLSRLPKSEPSIRRRNLGRMLAAGVLAVGVGSALWLPVLDLARDAARWDLSEANRTVWSLHPLGLIEVVWWFRWSDAPPILWNASLLKDLQATWLPSSYLGIPVLTLTAAAVVSRRESGRWFGVTALVLLLLAMGNHGLVYSWLARLLPVVRMLRFPVKAMVPTAFCAALLAGIGFDVWTSPRAVRPWVWRLGVQWPPAALAVVSAAGVVWSRIGVVEETAPPSLWAVLRAAVVVGPWLAIGVAAGVLVLAVALAARRQPGVKWAVVLAALALIDLLIAQRNQVPLVSPDLYRFRPQVLEWIDGRRLDRVYVDDYSILRRRAGRLVETEPAYRVARAPRGWTTPGAVALGAHMYLNPPTAARFGVYGSYDHDLLGLLPSLQVDMTEFLRGGATPAEHLRLLRIGAVDYALGMLRAPWWDQLEPLKGYEEVFEVPVRLFRVPDPLPRTYVVDGIQIAEAGETLDKLLDPSFDFRRTVVLPAGTPEAGNGSAPGTSRIVKYTADRVVLSVRLARPGVVVLVDAYGPGWTATLDGRRVPVLRANGVFRAVRSGAGDHEVELVYRPAAVSSGLLLAGISALIACLLAVRPTAKQPAACLGPG